MIEVELNMVLNTIDKNGVIGEINASKRVTMPVCPVVGMKISLRDMDGMTYGELEVTTVCWDEGKEYVEAYFADDKYHRRSTLAPIIANGWK